jgi:sugar lactone lactonase YvrE
MEIFIKNLNESSSIENDDYFLFDKIQNNGSFYTNKISFDTLKTKINYDIINIFNSSILYDINTSTEILANKIRNKLDKNGLIYSDYNRMTGPILLNNSLTANNYSFFKNNVNLLYNKIVNLSSINISDNVKQALSSYETFTFANLNGDSGSADGSRINAKFYFPRGITIDEFDTLYITDTYNHTIRKILSSGEVSTIAGSATFFGLTNGNGSEARFCYPHGITIDSSKNLYVCDTFNHIIRKITPSGEVTNFTGSVFNYPYGITIDSFNNLYVSDTFNHVIRKITPSGEITIFAGSLGNIGSTNGNGTNSKFHYPYGITIDSSNNLYVCDTGNQFVKKITPSKDVTKYAEIESQEIICDTNNNLFVSNTFNQTIHKINTEGKSSLIAGVSDTINFSDGLGVNVKFNYPYGITINSLNEIFVCDSQNNSIRKLTYTGIEPIPVFNPEDYILVNKKHVDDKVDSVPKINVNLLVKKTGDTLLGHLSTNINIFDNNLEAVTKYYTDINFPLEKFLPLSGGSMIGNTFVNIPLSNPHAVTKKYVDDNTPFGRFVPLSGNVSTENNINLPDPINENHATNKKYVDTNLISYLSLNGGTIKENLIISATPTSPNNVITKSYIDNILNNISLNDFVVLSGSTMIGNLSVLSPISDLHISSKKYADDTIFGNYLYLSGGKLNGNLIVPSLNKTSNNYIADSKYVLDIFDNFSEFAKLNGSYINGELIISNTPSLSNHISTKKYADDFLDSIKNFASNDYLKTEGGTLTGYLNTLTPVNANNIVNKNYVDSNFDNKYLYITGGSIEDITLNNNGIIEKNTIINLNENYINLENTNFYTINLSSNCSGFNIDIDNTKFYDINLLINSLENNSINYFNSIVWNINGIPVLWENNKVPNNLIYKTHIFNLFYANNMWFGSISKDFIEENVLAQEFDDFVMTENMDFLLL